MQRTQLGRWLATFVMAITLAPALELSGRADTVTEWNEIMQAAVTASGGTPSSNPNQQTRWGAIVQLAVFEAVNAIEGEYEPYLGVIVAPDGASVDAAIITAAHDTIVAVRPLSAATVGGLRDTALAAIPNGESKDAGIQVGAAAAAAMLLLRSTDGWDANVSHPGGTEPGQWRPELPSFTAALLPGWGQVTPFGLNTSSQFRLPPPPALHTERYARDLNEVKLLGRVDSAFRPQDRTDVARFYAVASPVQVWNSAARQVSADQNLTRSQNARLFALLAMAMADASFTAWETKYHYSFWRPLTAIRGADNDGNDLTEADSEWLPLINTPAHPSYASGHATVSGAARAVLDWAFGSDGHDVTLTHSTLPDIVLQYSAWDEITDDIDDARVYGGIHFTFDQEEGAHQGSRVGKFIFRKYLRPLEELDD